MHVSIASAVHDLTRSKQLIRIFNCLGLGISYDELERIDCALARRTIDCAGNHRVPIRPSIKGNNVIHGAMDNFDHEENSKSGKGGSHDTILVLFENNTQQNTFEEEYVVNKNDFEDQRLLNHILECQKLIRGHKFGVRGEIPINYETGTPLNTIDVENEADKRFRTWLLARRLKDGYTQNVPSFAAMNSLLFSGHHFLTEICFTPIVPYPATDYDTIFTCMKNIQDVLEQKSQKYGPLWCDEGVYRIAKELQLLNPESFKNIFLGLGGFHMEKIVLACLGKYLEEVGIEQVLVKNEVFGPVVAKQVMTGSHYIRSKRGMSIMAEALHRLYFSAFNESRNDVKNKELLTEVGKIQEDLGCEDGLDISAIQERWELIENEMTTFQVDLKAFNEKGGSENCMFT